MPAGYERMKIKFRGKGLSDSAAKRKAARIWNSRHPNDPVYPGRHRRSDEYYRAKQQIRYNKKKGK